MTQDITARTLPRDLKPGDEVLVWAPEGVRMAWVWRTITTVEKRPGSRADEQPTRYRVRYEGVPGHRLIAPGSRVDVRVKPREPDPAKGEYRDAGGQLQVCQACVPGSKARRHRCGLADLQGMMRIG
jgi:hypothetical protein